MLDPGATVNIIKLKALDPDLRVDTDDAVKIARMRKGMTWGSCFCLDFSTASGIYTPILAMPTLFGNTVRDIENAIWDGGWVIS